MPRSCSRRARRGREDRGRAGCRRRGEQGLASGPAGARARPPGTPAAPLLARDATRLVHGHCRWEGRERGRAARLWRTRGTPWPCTLAAARPQAAGLHALAPPAAAPAWRSSLLAYDRLARSSWLTAGWAGKQTQRHTQSVGRRSGRPRRRLLRTAAARRQLAAHRWRARPGRAGSTGSACPPRTAAAPPVGNRGVQGSSATSATCRARSVCKGGGGGAAPGGGGGGSICCRRHVRSSPGVALDARVAFQHLRGLLVRGRGRFRAALLQTLHGSLVMVRECAESVQYVDLQRAPLGSGLSAAAARRRQVATAFCARWRRAAGVAHRSASGQMLRL